MSTIHVSDAFRYEADLLEPALRWLRGSHLASQATWVVCLEQVGVSRIPDVVLARIDVAALLQRLKARAYPLTRAELRILRVLRHDKPTTIATLARRLRVEPKRLRRLAASLEGRDALGRTNTGSLYRTAPIRCFVTRFVSLELKLSDWRSALIQAAAHQTFAHEAWVGFDGNYRHRYASNIDAFRGRGVGMLSIERRSNAADLVVQAQRRRPDPLSIALVAERLLERLLHTTTTPLPESRLPSAGARSGNPPPPRLTGPFARKIARALVAAEAGPLAGQQC